MQEFYKPTHSTKVSSKFHKIPTYSSCFQIQYTIGKPYCKNRLVQENLFD